MHFLLRKIVSQRGNPPLGNKLVYMIRYSKLALYAYVNYMMLKQGVYPSLAHGVPSSQSDGPSVHWDHGRVALSSTQGGGTWWTGRVSFSSDIRGMLMVTSLSILAIVDGDYNGLVIFLLLQTPQCFVLSKHGNSR